MLELKWIIIFISMTVAVYYDCTQHKIKNFITFPTALLGCMMNFIHLGYSGLFISLKGWFLPVMLLFVFYSINVMGAGDIKFFGAIGAIMGYRFAITSVIFSIFFGAVIALILLVKRGQVIQGLKRVFNYVRFCIIVRRIASFQKKDDNTSKFPFTYAILPSVVVQFLLVS